MEGNYNHLQAEQKWQQNWATSNLYDWDINEPKANSFIIDTPPPTVSGFLHMGHVFSYTQTDFVARYKRMSGKNVFYPIGFDDNGLATERLVEKLRDIKAGQMHRDEFRKICEEVVLDAEEEFRGLFREIALSVDWNQEYRTVSQSTIQISQMSFLDLVKNGHAERRLAPTFWDPVDRTAIAQAEIEDKEKQGVMNDVVFKTEDGQDVTISTTRPELIPACVALLYHPEDDRYKHLQGKHAITPIWGAKVPIIADSEVAIDKGTGLVMCCTFGDIQDITWWRRHNLEIKQVIDVHGKMANSGKLDGIYAKAAKQMVIDELKELGLLTKQVDVTQFVKCAERSGAPLEIIPTYQWYVKLLDHKDDLIAKGRECKWHPEYMRVRYENWVNGLNQDWCISRQRYFGVPFPVWYSKRAGEEGKVIYANVDQLPLDPTLVAPKGYTLDEVEPETDVMDTWATSSLTPQINARGIKDGYAVDAERFKKLYPADLRPQAHEIIRTWSFYTIAKSMLHADSIPWTDLMLSGWCLAADKTKMSKSKGNVVTPKALIVEKGADSVRYWASNSKLGVDIAYSEETFKIGNKLINKLWNASKFVSIHLNNITSKPASVISDVESGAISHQTDKWILSRLHIVIDEATRSFEEFEYSEARSVVEEFFWKDFCDNYLELIKARIYDESAGNVKARTSAIHTIYHVLKTLYSLFAPFMPYLTEELNAQMFGGESIHKRGSWPDLKKYWIDSDIISQGEDLMSVLELVRKYKSVNNLSLKVELEQVTYSGSKLNADMESDLKNASNTKAIRFSEKLHDATLSSEDAKYSVSIEQQEQAVAAAER